ncbi:Uncharacterised protein [Candidatus Anstonella stagnisolia]|nr:Uncharacterised protein [Candidatus Anstonella stagnisolia]
MSFKFPSMPALLRENYEFALFALLFLYTFFSGDMFVSLLIGSGGLIWLALSRFLKSEKKNPTEKEQRLATLFTKYRQYAYYLLLISFILFLFLKSNAMLSLFFLVLIGLTMVFIVASESFAGYLEGGLRNEIREAVLAILWALSIWFLIGFLLGTKVPFNGVVSCSMVPNLERGDLLLLKADPANANTIALSKEGFDSLTSTATIIYAGSTYSFNGSIFAYCVQHPAEGLCIEFSKNAPAFVEMHGPVSFTYGYCERIAKGSGALVDREICVKEISYDGKALSTADIAVYEPNKGDLFSYSGDIVHRIVARFSYANSTKYITKGDNNPVADMQVYTNSMGNSPFSKERVKGIVAFKLPYLGFFKLALSSPLNPSLALAVENCESFYKN